MTNISYVPLVTDDSNTTNLNEPGSMRKTSTKRKRIDINERESIENEPITTTTTTTTTSLSENQLSKRAKNDDFNNQQPEQQQNNCPDTDLKRGRGRPRKSLATISSSTKKRTPLKTTTIATTQESLANYFQLPNNDVKITNELKQQVVDIEQQQQKQSTRVYNRTKSSFKKCTKSHLQRNKITKIDEDKNLVQTKIEENSNRMMAIVNTTLTTCTTNVHNTHNKTDLSIDKLYSLKIKEIYSNNQVDEDKESLKTPLPSLDWACNYDVWNLMKQKEQNYYHNYDYLTKHNGIESQMRGILLDWLVEICYAYRLHRETFHLSCEYIDRFLTNTKDMSVDRLQLIGLTALFLAAKAEEIYPPKLREFASHMESYADDNEEAITQFELFMLKSLNWEISPVTANTWLSTYIQIAAQKQTSTKTHTTKILIPTLNHHKDYLKAITLLDLCLFDMESLKFKYSELAASAMYHMIKPCELAFSTSGLSYKDLELCIDWMSSYADCIHDFEDKIDIEYFSNVDPDDAHNIQHYYQNLDLLKEAQLRKTPLKSSSAINQNEYSSLLTPPDSNKKLKK